MRFTKNPPVAPGDTLTCVRADGSTTSQAMLRQGILPHDAFHFVVEATLGFRDGLFGGIARGASLETATASAPVEALIACLEAGQWAGDADHAAFTRALAVASRRGGVRPLPIDAETLQRLRVALREFGAAWRPLAPGAVLERLFPE